MIMTVSISTNDGSSWKTILDSSDANLWNLSWSPDTWYPFGYSFLPGELVSSVLLKFSFDSVNASSNDHEGWYIDDIYIYTNGTMY